jgi:hypothetical protein
MLFSPRLTAFLPFIRPVCLQAKHTVSCEGYFYVKFYDGRGRLHRCSRKQGLRTPLPTMCCLPSFCKLPRMHLHCIHYLVLFVPRLLARGYCIARLAGKACRTLDCLVAAQSLLLGLPATCTDIFLLRRLQSEHGWRLGIQKRRLHRTALI